MTSFQACKNNYTKYSPLTVFFGQHKFWETVEIEEEVEVAFVREVDVTVEVEVVVEVDATAEAEVTVVVDVAVEVEETT